MADQKEKIKQMIMAKGPIIPSQISKELNTNILFASAMLSEMVDTGMLKLTHIKFGGSPVYYLPSQASLLQSLYSKLNDKQKKTYDLLKERKVLRDKVLDPVQRVSLRDMKDFAHPLEVELNGEVEIFWKWYLIINDEATEVIRSILDDDERNKKRFDQDVERVKKMQEDIEQKERERKAFFEMQTKQAAEHSKHDAELKASQASLQQFERQQQQPQRSSQFTPIQQTQISKPQENDWPAEEQEDGMDESKVLDDVEKKIKEERKKSNIFSKFLGMGKKKDDEPSQASLQQKELTKEEQRKIEVAREFILEHSRKKNEQKTAEKDTQEKIKPVDAVKPPAKPKLEQADDEFLGLLNKYFNKNNIKVMDFTIIKKKSEIDFMLAVPSAVGEIAYYCKAKNKVKCNEGDLSTTFVQAQMKKLPALFLTTGEITKKAQEMLARELKGIHVARI